MLLNLLVGLIAGLLVPRFERWLRDFSESVWLGGVPLSEKEFDMAALLVLLILASILLAILSVDSSAFLLSLGALFGLFGKRFWARVSMKESQ
ncbi:hypothetical protein jaqu_21000 [Jannaschia aquimarina]|uniref:Uncharacterized protein n=2 Tax=Jannaschia aquimarina TaxID=935700 RepID=A0A0D1D880_9RHOB|nr:hypothetical protein jaqu_21000 [Jannaschia aquimarina]SNT37260.1 hypothetical protein SAMN05421775_11343 [Jannaschia aquimarina]